MCVNACVTVQEGVERQREANEFLIAFAGSEVREDRRLPCVARQVLDSCVCDTDSVVCGIG